MKELKGQQAETIKEIINNGDYIFEIEGKRYEISIVSEKDLRRTTVKEDVVNDPQLMEILKQAKRDIQDEDYYTSEEMRELIREGKI